MTKIELNIPADIELAIEAAFPGQDKAAALLRLVRRELGMTDQPSIDVEPAFEELVQHALRLRATTPYVTDEVIRSIRDDLRG